MKAANVLLRGGEMAARHPFLGQDPRIPFSYQGKGRRGIKIARNKSANKSVGGRADVKSELE